eukprot:Rmarinus@m.11500
MAIWSIVLCRRKSTPYAAKISFFLSFVTYGTALVLWTTENVYCEHVQPYMFHAWWHILAGFGSYMWIVFLVALRAKHHRKRPVFRTAHSDQHGYCVPYVAFHEEV